MEKIWVGIYQGGNFPGGNFPGGSFPGGNFPYDIYHILKVEIIYFHNKQKRSNATRAGFEPGFHCNENIGFYLKPYCIETLCKVTLLH